MLSAAGQYRKLGLVVGRFSVALRFYSGIVQDERKAVGRVRRVIGPILTTGVSLLTAGVVVANPIVAPRADIAIPAVQLSAGHSETIGMLDQAFLDAIAPGPAGSSNPFSVLKQLITGLASDATSLGKNAMVDAFVAGVAAVSQPELTAFSHPYVAAPVIAAPAVAPASVPHGGFTAGLPAGVDSGAIGPAITALVPTAADFSDALSGPDFDMGGLVAPMVRDLVSSIVDDVEYVGNGLVAAAFAAGALVAHQPILIAKTLTALVNGDFEGALSNAVKVVVAPLGPPAMVYETLRNVVIKHLTPSPPGVAPAPAVQPAPGSPVLVPGSPVLVPRVPAPAVGGTTAPGARDDRRHRNDAPEALAPDADSVSAPVSVPDAVAVGTGRGLAGAAREAAGRVRDAIGAAGERGGGKSPAVTDVPVADVAVADVADAPVAPVAAVADSDTPPDVSDRPGRAAGRG